MRAILSGRLQRATMRTTARPEALTDKAMSGIRGFPPFRQLCARLTGWIGYKHMSPWRRLRGGHSETKVGVWDVGGATASCKRGLQCFASCDARIHAKAWKKGLPKIEREAGRDAVGVRGVPACPCAAPLVFPLNHSTVRRQCEPYNTAGIVFYSAMKR